MLAYIIIIRPYESFLSNFLSIANDSLLVFMIAVTVQFIDPVMTPTNRRFIGQFFIGIVLGTIALNWSGIIIFGVTQSIKAKLRKRKIKKLEKSTKLVETEENKEMKEKKEIKEKKNYKKNPQQSKLLKNSKEEI